MVETCPICMIGILLLTVCRCSILQVTTYCREYPDFPSSFSQLHMHVQLHQHLVFFSLIICCKPSTVALHTESAIECQRTDTVLKGSVCNFSNAPRRNMAIFSQAVVVVVFFFRQTFQEQEDLLPFSRIVYLMHRDYICSSLPKQEKSQSTLLVLSPGVVLLV